MKRIFYCGMDTTNTMSGVNNGLQKFIRNVNPHCSYVKCHNHKLALIFVHCGKEHKIIKDFTGVMNSYYLMYNKSSLRREVREEVFDNAKVKARAPQKAVPTRWLSIEPQNKKLVDNFYNEVDSLLAIIAKARPGDDCIKIRGIVENLLNPKMMMLMLALRDILPMFNTVQTLMQARKFIFSDIKALKEVLVSKISYMLVNQCFEGCECSNKSCKMGQFPERFKWAKQTAQEHEFMEHHISYYDDFSASEFWRDELVPILRMIRDEVDDALSFSPELEGLAFLDPAYYPEDLKQEELESLGEEQFGALVKFFATEKIGKKNKYYTNTSPPQVNEENAMKEFKQAKRMIVDFRKRWEHDRKVDLETKQSQLEQLEKGVKNMSARKSRPLRLKIKGVRKSIKELETATYDFKRLLVDWFNSTAAKNLEDVSFLMQMAAILPASTAIVESSWSIMNLHCDAHSSTLTQDHLNCLMHVSLSEKPVYYDKVFEVWINAKKRRTKAKSKSQEKESNDQSEDEESNESQSEDSEEGDSGDSDDSEV